MVVRLLVCFPVSLSLHLIRAKRYLQPYSEEDELKEAVPINHTKSVIGFLYFYRERGEEAGEERS